MRAGPSAGHAARRLADRPPSFPFRRYQPEGFACANTLLGHSHFVGAVAAAGTGVASGSNDKHVIEWDVSQGTPMRILEGHTWCEVHCLALCGDTLASGSSDPTIRLWSASSAWACERVLRGHRGNVNAMTVHGDKLVSGSDDCMIRFWNSAADWACERTLQFPRTVRTLKIMCGGNELAVGLHGGSIVVKSLATGETLRSLTFASATGGFACYVRSLRAYGGKLVSATNVVIQVWGKE